MVRKHYCVSLLVFGLKDAKLEFHRKVISYSSLSDRLYVMLLVPASSGSSVQPAAFSPSLLQLRFSQCSRQVTAAAHSHFLQPHSGQKKVYIFWRGIKLLATSLLLSLIKPSSKVIYESVLKENCHQLANMLFLTMRALEMADVFVPAENLHSSSDEVDDDDKKRISRGQGQRWRSII